MLEKTEPKVISSIFDEKGQLIPELIDKEYFLFDAYGVFWDGLKLIQATVDDMQRLVTLDKKVCVVSNTTQLSKDAIKSYKNRGLNEGKEKHYNEFITSGDVFRDAVLNGSLQEQIEGQRTNKLKEKGKIKVFIFGNPRKELFKDSNFDIVNTPKEADCVYLSIPSLTKTQVIKAVLLNLGLLPESDYWQEYMQWVEKLETTEVWKRSLEEIFEDLGFAELTEEQKEKLEQLKTYFQKSILTKSGEPERWDVIKGHKEIFYPFLDEFMRLKLPILNANPDRSAPEKDAEHPKQKNNVVRNGALTEYIREEGGKVFEYGKPNVEIFKYALKLLVKECKTKLESLKALESKLETIKQTLPAPKQEEGDQLEDEFTEPKVLEQRTVLLGQIKAAKEEVEKTWTKIERNVVDKTVMFGDTPETDGGIKKLGGTFICVSTGNGAKYVKKRGEGTDADYFLNRTAKASTEIQTK